MEELKNILGPMRIPFLLLTPACVLVGIGTAVWTSGHVNAFHAILALIGAISAHISVNALNEYFDFSGGSGVLPKKPNMSTHALTTGWLTFAVTALVGIYFLTVRGILLLPLGIAGLLVIFFYTIWFTRNPLLCLIAPGLGFGPLMVMGTDFVLTGSYSLTAFFGSLVPFFLVSNLLLLNQFPDIEADKTIGRRHFPITVGTRTSSFIYGIFLLLAYMSIMIGILLESLPASSLLGLLTIVIAVPAFIGALKHGSDIKKLVPFMGLNVVINILTPILVAVGLFIG